MGSLLCSDLKEELGERFSASCDASGCFQGSSGSGVLDGALPRMQRMQAVRCLTPALLVLNYQWESTTARELLTLSLS